MDSQQRRDQQYGQADAHSHPSAPADSRVEQNNQSAADNQPSEDFKNTTNELVREFKWFEILSLVINGALAIIGFFALYVYNGQLTVMRGQLEQMKGGSAQTDRLINETHALAAAAKAQSDSAAAQARSMKDLAGRALAQAKATNALAGESKRAADTASKALTVQSRPWMAIAGEPVITAILPVSQDAREIRAQFTLKNVGGQPAMFVAHSAIIGDLPNPGGSPGHENIRDYDAVADSECVWASGMTRPVIHFPTRILTPQRMEAEWRTSGGYAGPTMFPGDSFVEGAAGQRKIDTGVAVIGCIAYSDQLGNTHQTRFCFGHFTATPIAVGDHLRTCIYGNRAD
jgi:hypothetical protein